MNKKVVKTLTDYLNNLVEADTRERWSENNRLTREELFVRRMVIIDNPREGIYKAVRRFGESRLGVHDSLYDAFPAGLIKITLRFVGKRMDDNRCTLKDLIPDLSIAEENTPAAFPRMLALLASEWLTKQERWKTKKFKKLIAYLERRQKQNEAE